MKFAIIKIKIANFRSLLLNWFSGCSHTDITKITSAKIERTTLKNEKNVFFQLYLITSLENTKTVSTLTSKTKTLIIFMTVCILRPNNLYKYLSSFILWLTCKLTFGLIKIFWERAAYCGYISTNLVSEEGGCCKQFNEQESETLFRSFYSSSINCSL